MIKGNKVNIVALNDSNRDLILKWANKPELKRLTGTIYPISDIEHLNWYNAIRQQRNTKYYGIEEKETKSLIGIVGLKNINWISKNCELFIYIGEESFRGRSLGTDSVNTLLQFVFQELNMYKVYLYVFDYNEKAKKTYEKLGFEVEGLLKSHMYKEGKYHNVYLMSIFKEE